MLKTFGILACFIPAIAMAQGVIPLNDSAVFSQQPVQATGGNTITSLATRAGNRLDLVADFGADPTGVADISAALNNAIAANKPIFIPAGSYLLSGTVADTELNNVDIQCAGPGFTIITISGSIAIAQPATTNPAFSLLFKMSNCGVSFSGAGQISLSATAQGNYNPLNGPIFDGNQFTVNSGTANPVILFNNISFANISGNFALDATANDFFELEGQGINNIFTNNTFWHSGTQTTTGVGLYVNANATVGNSGIQGTILGGNDISYFAYNAEFLGNLNTIQISNSMFDGAYVDSLDINPTVANDVRVSNSYIFNNSPANTGDNAVYIGTANNVKFENNTVGTYAAGNNSFNLSSATANGVSLVNNTYGSVYNPNNVPLAGQVIPGPISAQNVLDSQLVIGTTTALTSSQAGVYVILNPSATGQTITLPDSQGFNNIGSGIFYFENVGSVPINIATVATDHNDLPGGGLNNLGGVSVLGVNETVTAYSNPGAPGWNAIGYNDIGQKYLPNLTVNGIVLGNTPGAVALGTNPPVSGTAYQWAGPGTLQLAVPVTMSQTSTAAATATLGIGATSTTATRIMASESRPDTLTAGAGEIVTLRAEVPAGWYYEVTVTTATIGTATAIVH